jgi:glycine cleavage system H protein
VESVKVASDIYAPVTGSVLASNGELETGPERINAEPYEAWFIRIRPEDPAELDALLDAAAYTALIPAEG